VRGKEGRRKTLELDMSLTIDKIVAVKRSRHGLIRDGIVVLIVLCSILWFFLFSGRMFHSHASDASNRDALVQLHQAIQIGSTADEVRELFR
jgi:hypothetical protein